MTARLTLGIETSCDETSAAVVQDGRTVLSDIIASQAALHRPYGGVVPEIAARKHIEEIEAVVEEALAKAGVSLADIDEFAVANGPGLAGALLVGLSYAKALAYASGKPLIGVHHIEGHVCANYLNGSALTPPFICLVVSGGHTVLLKVADYNTYTVLGRTRDDAAGEAFDKVARLLGLPYPGGPQIDALSAGGDPCAVRFPRARLNDAGGGLDFSFSGLKSAVAQYVSREAPSNSRVSAADIAASFQQAVTDVLVGHTLAAAESAGIGDVALAGGVAANKHLRAAMRTACQRRGLRLFMPKLEFCTDNAAMIACRGYYALQNAAPDGYDLNAYPSRLIGECAQAVPG